MEVAASLLGTYISSLKPETVTVLVRLRKPSAMIGMGQLVLLAQCETALNLDGRTTHWQKWKKTDKVETFTDFISLTASIFKDGL